eukprot:maker-scaffold_41-snap-gene-0.32-mRNA-1 protein AED:0.04 eAED:0.04 QI:229/0.66/0.75/1/1/1/4/220/295
MDQVKPDDLRKKTSLEVFSKFTRRNENEDLIFENIISKECFKEWVKTRSGQLKNPKGAFRRTIYAHLRGADGRAPFLPDVEASILLKLRAVSSTGKPIDPFTAVLGNRKKFRRNGNGGWLPEFKFPYGYHENCPNDSKTQTRTLTRGPTRSRPKKVDDLDAVEKFLKLSRKQMMDFLQQGEQVSRHFNSICYMVVNTLDGRFLHKDQNSKKIFGSSPYVMQLAPSVTEYFNSRREVSKQLQAQGTAWFRSTIFVNGVRYVFKAFIRPISPEVENVFFQLELDNVVTDEALNRLLV